METPKNGFNIEDFFDFHLNSREPTFPLKTGLPLRSSLDTQLPNTSNGESFTMPSKQDIITGIILAAALAGTMYGTKHFVDNYHSGHYTAQPTVYQHPTPEN